MIIVEGPDGSGKSTLIDNLGCERRRLKSLRGGVGGTRFNGTGDGVAGWGGNDPALLAYTRKVIDGLKHEKENRASASGGQGLEFCDLQIAFDRFHLSEVVYGPILRRVQEVSDGDLAFLDDFIRRQGVKVVMCLPPFAVTLANATKNGRERPSYQTEGFLHQAYKEFERLAPWATVVYDYTRDKTPQI